MKSPRQWLFAAVTLTAAFFLLSALWIPAKARLAQHLLESAWQRTLEGESNAKPWPWADTSPVGVLEVPALGIRQIVLSGTSGRNLAFGPTLLSAPELGDLLLSGHRDTHFSFIQGLQKDELMRFTSVQGTREYRVAWQEVIDTRRVELVIEPGIDRLTLATCYPFDSLTPGGPLRYIVTARPISGGAETVL